MHDLIVKAPARICLFGDHQDYLGLPIIACAMNRYITVEASKDDSRYLSINMPDIGEKRTIAIDEPLLPVNERDYFVSGLQVAARYGCIPSRGYSITISGDIPINSGLSSSSALVVAWITFLVRAYGCSKPITQELIAHLAYTAEVLEYNQPGGLMDQYTISLGQTIYLDTVTGKHMTIPKQISSLIIGESGVPKQTLSILKFLRGYAQDAITPIQQQKVQFDIKEVTMDDYDKYENYVPEHLKPYFFAALKNYSITKKAFKELNKEDYNRKRIGELMTQHHLVLKNILKITVPIIDRMIDGALQAGAYGAKIVGSGGGGCIVALTDEKNEQNVINGILKGGAKKAYVIQISNGVTIN